MVDVRVSLPPLPFPPSRDTRNLCECAVNFVGPLSLSSLNGIIFNIKDTIHEDEEGSLSLPRWGTHTHFSCALHKNLVPRDRKPAGAPRDVFLYARDTRMKTQVDLLREGHGNDSYCDAGGAPG